MSDLISRDRKYIWHPYTQMKTAEKPLAIVRGKDALLYDENGKEYIDAIASWWVNPHGHANKYIADKVYEQLNTLEHVIFAGFTHEPAINLAERLLGLLPEKQKKVFFSDNGSTAVEIAIKMSIQYFHNRGIKKRKMLAFENAFHGETFGAMAASGGTFFDRVFGDFLFEVIHIPVPVPGKEEEALARFKEAIQDEELFAFIFEPLVQGAAGMVMYSAEVLDEMVASCQQRGILTIADEVMTGFGRTGKHFSCEHLQHQPDLMCFSKCLTGGAMAMAITSCTQEIFDAFLSDDKLKAFFHGHSFTANPLGCAAAMASLDLLESADCQQAIQRIVASHTAFRERIHTHPKVAKIRQQGTILAIEFQSEGETSYYNSIRDQLYDFYLQEGVLLRPLGNIVYILPPYCITEEQLDRVYRVIEASLDLFSRKPKGDS